MLVALLCLFSVQAHSQLKIDVGRKSFEITVRNTTNKVRENQPVVLSLQDIIMRSAVVKDGRKEIPCQMDDLDADGYINEVTFVIDLKPLEEKKLKVELSVEPDTIARFPKKVHAQLLKNLPDKSFTPVDVMESVTGDLYNALHHHGPAFESELMAYRIYFDQKQTVDLYGKVKKQLELEQTNWYPTDEQLAAGFGDDILLVGGSVGLGTLRGWNGEKAVHITPVENRKARIIASGPVRTIVDMTSYGWEYMGEKITMVCRYTMYAGHRDVEVTNILLKQTPNGMDVIPKDVVFCTGVQKMPESEKLADNDGLLGIWGTNWPVNDTIKYAKQTVGLGIYIPGEHIIRNAEDKVNHLMLVHNNEEFFIKYYITAAAKKEEFGYKSAAEFFEYLRDWKEEIRQPVEVMMVR